MLTILLILLVDTANFSLNKNVLYLSQCPVSQMYRWPPLGLLNVLNYITLLPVVIFFTRCVSFMLRFVHVCLLLFMCLLFCLCCVIRGLILRPCGPSPHNNKLRLSLLAVFPWFFTYCMDV